MVPKDAEVLFPGTWEYAALRSKWLRGIKVADGIKAAD